jgi:hypothetical protein
VQAGVGGGMKAGINIWRALRDIKLHFLIDAPCMLFCRLAWVAA